MSFFPKLAVAVLLGLIFLIGGTPSCAQTKPDGELRVLFVGNSLTYVNDLPGMVEALAREAGQKKFVQKSVAFPDFSLEDHWNQGEAVKVISEGWDVVVMQQGPSALPESRVLLLEYTRRFAKEIRKAGGRPGLYAVWPFSTRQFDFDGVNESYRLAAKEVDGVFFPVGEAWKAAWRRDPNQVLYSEDGFHPSPAATYLAALVMYGQLYGRSPVGLPSKFRTASGTEFKMSKKRAELLQKSAEEAIERFGKP